MAYAFALQLLSTEKVRAGMPLTVHDPLFGLLERHDGFFSAKIVIDFQMPESFAFLSVAG
jgi:hypothetical protein